MKIVADEGVERPIILRLRAEGYEVISIAEIASGSSDLEILKFAMQEEALLITLDKDFGDLVFKQHHETHGVILSRLPDTLSSLEKADIVFDVIQENGEMLLHTFTVIALNKNRVIRLLPKPNHPEAG